MYSSAYVAFIGTVHAAIAIGCFFLARYLAERIQSRIGRTLATWPLYGLALIFASSAAFTFLANMITSWLGSE